MLLTKYPQFGKLRGRIVFKIPLGRFSVISDFVPGAHFSFGLHQEHGLWPDPKQEVREFWTFRSSTQTKFEM